MSCSRGKFVRHGLSDEVANIVLYQIIDGILQEKVQCTMHENERQ